MRLLDTTLEQNRKIINHRITPANLLHELATRAQQHPPKVLRPPIAEQRLERCAPTSRIPGRADGIHDDGFLELGFRVGDLEAAQRGDDGFAFFEAVARQQPAGGLGQPDHADADDQREDDLEGDGEAPDEGGGAVRGAEVDPVGD